MDIIKKANYIDNTILKNINNINNVRDRLNENVDHSDLIELRDLLMTVSLYFDEKFMKIEEMINKLNETAQV